LWANEKFLKRYNGDVVAALSRHAGKASDVLEFGAGIGTLALLWQDRTKVKPECLEIDDELRATLQQRGLVCHRDIDAMDQSFDTIYSSNVLEHIDDDVAMLKKIHARLKPGGNLALFVPAFMCIYSDLDAAVGHYRRYEKAELLEKLRLAGFVVQDCHYADSIGFFAWWSTRLSGYSPDKKLGSNNSLAVYDRFIYPLSKLLDWVGFRHLFGKNIVVHARRSA
jgi:SAM-dependent methyltransferase